jgi:FMN phosphatase YigB (HAD superfamily)
MPITLLLDLDDTLLDTNTGAFAPAYFQALAQALAEFVPPERMLPALMGGTKAMMLNLDPARTLKEVFDDFFFPQLGLERAALQERIDHFYAEVFPGLASVTRQRPEAIEFVDWALQAGHRLVVATNPYFPLQAVRHRLRWAGLPPEKYPFALISSYEIFHFTKEAGAYFPEVLGQLGWPEDPLVMIGNDLQMDLEPARKVGLPVYWLRTGSGEEASDLPKGNFSDLRLWLESSDCSVLQASLDSPEAILASLRATPAALSTLISGLPDKAWSRASAPGEWSLNEMLCHLRDVEIEVHQPRLRKILTEPDPFIAGVASDAWAAERGYARQDGRQAFETFLRARKETIALITDLQAEWSRPARHAIFGPTTLQEQLGIAASHDRAHLQQVWKSLPA